MENEFLYCYDYTYYDDPYDDKLLILMWGLNRKSEICCVRINNFSPFCYIELPMFVGTKKIIWNSTKAEAFEKALGRMLKDDKPTRCVYQQKPRIYYYKGDIKHPMILAKFPSLKAMKHCANVLKKPLLVEDIGKVEAKIHEHDINPVLKMLTIKNIGFAQWIKIDGKRVDDSDKLSSAVNEFKVKWNDIYPLPSETTKDFNTNPMLLSFDFETYSHRPKMFPEPYFIEDAIFNVSCVYQKLGLPETRKRVVIVYGHCDSSKIDNADEVIIVHTEEDLLENFKQLFIKVDPVIITGYNILGFDYRYMDSRIGLGVIDSWGELGKLKGDTSTIKKIQWQSSAYGIITMNILNTPGRVSIDLLPLIKRDYKLDKYDLETVSQYFLGVGKHDVKAEQMFEAFKLYLDSKEDETLKEKADDAMTHIVKYCVQDSDLVVNLFEKLNIWVSLVELSNVVSVPIMDLFTRGQQIRCQSQIYRLSSLKGYVITKDQEKHSNYTGGSVYEPVPGLYENVICLDFASLYPSIMRAYNICFTTLVPPEYENDVKDEDCNIIEFEQYESKQSSFKDNSSESDVEIDIEEADEDEDNKGKVLVYKRFKFIKKHIRYGILPELVANLVNERSAVRKYLDGGDGIEKEKNPLVRNVLNSRQLALKVSANSFYGFLGVQKGKMPLVQGAMCITAKGRELIKIVGDWIEQTYKGHIVYGDTDSCMVSLPQIKTSEECNEWGLRLSKEISELFPAPLRMEFEKAMRILCFKKKKYMAALINKKGEHMLDPNKILKKGIVLARRDNCKYLRKVYTKLSNIILSKGKIEDSFNVLIEAVEDMLNNKVDPKELSIIKTLGDNYKSDSYFMKVFGDHLKEQGKMVEAGQRLEFVYIINENEPLLGRRMKLIEDFDKDKDELDIIYYIEHMLMNPLDQLFSVGYKDILDKNYDKGLKIGRKILYIRFPMKLFLSFVQTYESKNLSKFKDWFKNILQDN